MAANVVLPFTHTAGKPQDASEFMANLRAIQAWITTNAQLLDGTVAIKGTLTGPASDPTTTAQYMRKSYVDAFITALAASRVTADRDTPRHGCAIRRTATAQTFTTTPSLVSFTAEDHDTDNYFAPTSTTITIPAGQNGLFAITGYAAAAAPANGFSAWVYINGVQQGNSFLFTIGYSGVGLVALSVGDTITVKGQSGTATIDATVQLLVERLGAS